MDCSRSGSCVSLKWHKALTWFLLFLNALYFIWQGIVLLLDAVFGLSGMTDRFWAGSTAGRVLFGLFGLLFMAIAVFSIHTRFQLAHFAPNGPRCLSILLGAGALTQLVFPLLFSLLASGSIHFDAMPLLQAALAILLLVANRVYYRKRADLFCQEDET